jgi:hypothetical protein
MKINLDEQVRQACRHLLSEINRDPATPTYGCFDRRYWAWKLVDFPEATYQRNLANLAWYMQNSGEDADPEVIKQAVIAGLRYSARIQHRDGSFDQAFPFERSFGATGFLLPDLIKAYDAVKEFYTEKEKCSIEDSLKRSADFLCRSAERHGLISNHLAGASLGLYKAADLFEASVYRAHAEQLLELILANQSPEGWFPEYGGADPGYQTLSMHYLSQIYRLAPSEELKTALDRSLDFLQYFVHPDGSFGGEYGSRRTEVYYPGGIALLSMEFPLASAIHEYMRKSIGNLATVTLVDIDMGNMAPLLSSTILSLQAPSKNDSGERLPFEQDEQARVFRNAGIAIRGNNRYYAILGVSNGGVFKVFDKRSKNIANDDCGALVELGSGKLASTQFSNINNRLDENESRIICDTSFYRVSHSQLNPWNILVLRLMNLTVMRFSILNEWIKKMLVDLLIKPSRQIPLRREREVVFKENEIIVKDTFCLDSQFPIEKMRQGIKFNSIHMASSRYYCPHNSTAKDKEYLDTDTLNSTKKLYKETKVVLDRENHP